MNSITPFDISAILYIPAIHKDLKAIVLGNKYPNVKAIIICFEDAVLTDEIPFAIKNVRLALEAKQIQQPASAPILFIRPRSLEMADQFIANHQSLLHTIEGLALPKFTLNDIPHWATITQNNHLLWMPILETIDVYDIYQMTELANALKQLMFNKILVVRIGGNDLLSLLGLRRSPNYTLYESPLGYIIKMLVSIFASKGFKLTAPVCEVIDNLTLLQTELTLDIQNGLTGKTAIHPSQIPIIQHAFKVEHHHYQDALKIINAKQAVFKSNGSMCEVTTHRNWALNIIERANKFGLLP